MDRSRKASRERNEVTLQHKSPQDALLVGELNDNKLAQLQDFVSRLEQMPPGAEELQRRTKLFGECKQIEGETAGQFYARLRHWLDRDFPKTKSPRHAPRQNDD